VGEAVKAACGSGRCECDHTLCDYGWFTVTVRHPVTGQHTEAATKCLHCFPPPAPVEADALGRRKAHPHLDARDFGADYPDHAAAAAGEK
jgi:hypothetical protein